MKQHKFKKGDFVKSLTTGAIGKIVEEDIEYNPFSVEVKWIKKNKYPATGYPTTFQYDLDLQKIRKKLKRARL